MGVTASGPRVSVRVATPEGSDELFVRCSDVPLLGSGALGTALSLLPAMRFGGELELAEPVSESLRQGVAIVQDVFLGWDHAGAIRHLALQPVALNAPSSDAPAPGQGVGCFFSGGVDSFYTLLERRDEITDIVVVHGFDVRLDDQPLRRALSEAATDVARTLGKALIEIETDARRLGERYVTWNHYFGCLLVAVAYALAPRLSRVMMGTGHTYASLIPDGANPILDAPWSRGPVRIVSHGAGATRTQKIAALAREPLAMRWLRVCWENRDGAYNCGRCEKCLRTKVALRAVGALERCRTMPGPLEHGALCGPSFRGIEFMWREMLRDLELMNADPKLRRAVRRALAPGLPRDAAWAWYRLRRALRRRSG